MRVDALGGKSLGHYRLLECLGHSSCTAVYRAQAGDEQCALKVVDGRLQDGGELRERLRREGAILDRLAHPGIVPIRDAIRRQGLTGAAMPLETATTLAELMARGSVDGELAWSVLNQIATSLDLAHEQGLTYRVLKPVNVLVDRSGRAYLTEFGVTGDHLGRLALATPDFLMSAPQYLAPEQIRGGRVDRRTDVYALAVLVFELATGTPLHPPGTAAEVLRRTLAGRPPSARQRNPLLPEEVDPVLRRALDPDPTRRQKSVWELLEQLVAPLPSAPGSGLALAPPLLEVVEGAAGQELVEDAYFAACLAAARQAAGTHWSQVAARAGLQRYLLQDPPVEGRQLPAAGALSRLADALETLGGAEGPRLLSEWGALANRRWLEGIQQRPAWMAGPATGRLVDMLSVFVESLNRARGADRHSWRQVNRQLFRIVHDRNLTALGRRRPSEACHFWIGAYQTALEWAGLAGEWLVAEVECGCVSGTDQCVFTIVRAES